MNAPTRSSLRVSVCLTAMLCVAPLPTAPAAEAPADAITIAIRADSEAGGLNIRSPHCPGDVFDFRTCEGVVVGSQDFGLFQVKLPPAFGDGIKSWRRDGPVWSYTWPYAQGLAVRVEVEPDGDSLKLAYTLTNTGTTPLDGVQLHTCLPTTEAPGFLPAPAVRGGQTNWSELYRRLTVWSGQRAFRFAETSLAATELHLSLMRENAQPVRWGWWVNGPETFDLPLVALSSRDGRVTAALAFEQAIWASANVGDDRACFHLFPWFGRIEPGQSVRVRGRLYVLAGGPLDARRRFERDFPAETRVFPAAGTASESRLPAVSERAVAFYYPWYGNPATDGRYANWNHAVAVREGPSRSFPGGDDIGANFYPALGAYSSNDPQVLDEHMRQLRRAGVGVLCVSWWGKDTFTDRALPGLFRAAEAAGLMINFHVEPFPGRNANTTRAAIEYLVSRHGASPAFHRLRSHGNRPVFFVYDSYLSPASDWATVLQPGGTHSIRGTAADAVVIGLWVKEREEDFMLAGGFDGFYTYFATDGFTYGSTVRNWPQLARWARAHGKLFVPCVAPGYLDTRIRPWNGVNTRDREAGAYYDRLWTAALAASSGLVGITSFNEWHEGTQIEPAVPKQIPGFTYLDYQPRAPDYYLDRTAYWVGRLRESGE